MKIRTAATAAITYFALGATSIAIAQTAWPQLTRGDLEACRTVLTKAHQSEFAYIQGEVDNYCSPNGKYRDEQNCKTERQWLAETKATDDVAWFFKGQEHCEGSDYPCFGPGLFNDPRTGADAAEWSQRFAEMAAEGTTISPGMEFWEASGKGDNCLAGLWVKKAKAAGFKATAVVQSPPPPPPAPVKAAPAPAPTRVTATDPGFQSNLKTYAADQLLALTNELIETGQIDLAKLARNSLLQRFPDSPLVPIVAQLITNAAKPGAQPAGPAPPPASASKNTVSSASASGERVYINNMAQLTSAFARFGIIMNPTAGSQDEAQESGNLFSAYLSDCRDGQCHALQLLSRYALSPMPSPERVQSWNTTKLYGRAFINGDRVHFDMVVLIPENGVDIKALEEAVKLYKDACGAFYTLVKP